MHDIVLLEELCKHLGSAQGVDVWRDKKDDGGRGGEGRATVSGKDGGVGIAVGWPRGGSEMGWWEEDHDH